jgi:hypothetical protein
MKRALRRLVLALGFLALAVYPVFLIAANGYLRSQDLGRRLSRHPERLSVSYESAWTSWPGVIHVRGFEIRNQTRTAQWWARMDRATFRLRLLDLGRRELVVDHLSGSGVTFHLRRRLDHRWSILPRAALQPPVPGLENPPRRPPEALYPPSPRHLEKARTDPWRIRLAAIELDDVREVWIDEYRLAGEARVAGGFDLRVGRRLSVDPTRLQIVAGDLTLGGGARAEPVLTGAAGRVDGEIAAYSPAEHRGWEAVRFLSGRARLHGAVPSLAFLDPLLAKTGWLSFGAREARVETDVRVERGRFLPGSRLTGTPRSLSVSFLDYTASGAGSAVWQVVSGGTGRGPERASRLDLDFSELRLQRRGYPRPHVRGKGLRVAIDGGEPRLIGRDLFTPERVAIELPWAEVPQLSFYNAYLPARSGLALGNGPGRIRASFRAAAPSWEGSGDLRLLAPGADAVVLGRSLHGDLDVRTRLAKVDFRGRSFDVSGSSVDLTRVSLAGVPGAGPVTGWWARARLGQAVLSPGAPVLLRARAESTLSDSRPLFAFFGRPRKGVMTRWLEHLLDVRGVGAKVDLVVGNGAVRLDHLAIAGGPAKILGRLRFGDRPKRGILYASYGSFDIGVELQGEQRDWKLLHPLRWYESYPAFD